MVKPMEILSRTEFREDLKEHLNKVCYAGEQVVVGSKGIPEVALVPYAWLEAYETLLDRLDLHNAKEALKEADKEGTVPWEEVKAEAGL